MNRRNLDNFCVFAVPAWIATSARMKSRKCFLPIAAICVLGVAASTSAQVFPVDGVGYTNIPLSMGQSLIGNPLDAEVNSLNGIFDPLSVPHGTMLTKWDAANGQYLPDSIFGAGGWSINYPLVPGEGALLTAPIGFMNLFIGRVLTLENPSPLANIAAGSYLLASRAPIQLGPGSLPVFESIIGRVPRPGERFRWLDPTTQLFHSTTFAGGAWDNGPPALNVGQAAFFIFVPEPSTFAASVFVFVIAITWRIRHAWEPVR